MIIVENTEIVTKMREKFLTLDAEGKTPLDATLVGKKNVIYMIVNLLNGKRYIGKTTYLLNRANNYIHHCRHTTRDSRPILQDMRKYGIENFRMFPIAISENRAALAEAEYRYIVQYDTLIPKGYNLTLPSGTRYNPKRDAGHPHTISTKMKKSKLVLCVNPDTHQMFVSIGMKLFGDYIGKSKDIIKNAAKQATRICGFYIIYLNSTDLTECEHRYLQRNYKNGPKNDYLAMVSDVKTMLFEENPDVYTENGYTCNLLTYNNESEVPTYKFLPIEEFFAMNQSEE